MSTTIAPESADVTKNMTVKIKEVIAMTDAADELGITQPLVSQRIRSLEEELGSVLLD